MLPWQLVQHWFYSFPPTKAYYVLDEFMLGGCVQETSKKQINKAIASADMLQEVRMYVGAYIVTLIIDYWLSSSDIFSLVYCLFLCSSSLVRRQRILKPHKHY